MAGIFIDCGANQGDTLVEFARRYPGHALFAFEPNPRLVSLILARQVEIGRPVALLNAAVWVSDGVVPFKLVSRKRARGSTLLDGKTNLDPSLYEEVEVLAVDFGAWLRRSARPGDDVVVKMDVEGAEYDVLGQMLADGSIDLVSRLYCEWHHDRFPQITRDRHEGLVQALRRRTVLEDWD